MSFQLPTNISAFEFGTSLESIQSVIQISKEEAGPCEIDGLEKIENHHLHAMAVLHCVANRHGIDTDTSMVVNALLLMAIKGDTAPGLRYYLKACNLVLQPSLRTELISMFYEYSNQYRRMAA